MSLGKGVLKIWNKFVGEHSFQSEFNKLHFGMGVLLYIKFAACIFSEHIFLRTPMDGCFWYRPFSTPSSCTWKGVNLHVVETKWGKKVSWCSWKRGRGRNKTSLHSSMNESSCKWPQKNQRFLNTPEISRGVHKKPQVLVCGLGISTYQQGQGFHWVREVQESQGFC